MPARRAATRAPKRDLSDSLSPPPSPPPKKARASKASGDKPSTAKTTKAKASQTPNGKPTSTSTGTSPLTSATPEADAKPKPKAKGKAAKWPPAGLEPPYPERQGLPAFKFADDVPKVDSLNGVNGAIVPLDPEEPLRIGAHVSMAGGYATALFRAAHMGANGLAFFVKGHRTWKSKEMDEGQVGRWEEVWGTGEGRIGYDAHDVLVHGNYLVNLGNPDPVKWAQAYECYRDDIARCHALGIRLYNWHPGSTVGACTKEESFDLVAKAINQVHKDVPEVITVIENMANAGSNILGTAFSDLAGMISRVEDKSRVRVCIDTCHLFASGYDMRTPETYAATMDKFSKEVGFEYLGGIHLNDSKADLGGNKDLHENIGLGKIGLSGFRSLVRDGRMQGIPMVLETPTGEESEVWKEEVGLLYEIQRVEDGEWEGRKGEIEARWRKRRDELAPPKEKGAKTTKAKGRGKKGKKDESSEDECDSC